VTLGHKHVQSPHRDPLPSAVHSLLSPTPRIRLSVFSDTCALFHFLDHSYLAFFPQLAHSSAKNRGYTPLWSYHASSFLFTIVYPESDRRVYPERDRKAHPPQLQRKSRACPPKLQRRRAISCISPAYECQPCMSLVSPTYAKTGEYTPTPKCRRADIFDFSPYFSHFSCPERGAKGPVPPARLRRRHKAAPTNKTGHASPATGLPAAASAEEGHLLCYPTYRRPFLP